ncbi:MAG: apolipoprotein N-acyltransferase [Bacteroidetes bacterium]|nr:apolipoprotein N-acyltransferase [Bacteroidota bacterium]MBK7108899.1 apolipoprotein N-acyltransferase [Bacteroidota bacterium]
MRNRIFLTAFFLLPLLSALLLWLAWPPLSGTLLVFIGFVPLLFAEELIENNYSKNTQSKSWLAIFIGLLAWNGFTTWWVANTYSGNHEIGSLIAGIFASFANAALMTLPFMGYRYTKKRLGRHLGLIAFAAYWMVFEYVHLRWEFTWPWLNLGNVFALNHTWIQWYEYTGTFGGTLWVLLTNLIVYAQLRKMIFKKQEFDKFNFKNKYLPFVMVVLIIIVPIIISKVMYAHQKDIGLPVNVTALQPNLNPYTEKFTLPFDVQLQKMIRLSSEGVTDSTDYLIWPETAIPHPIYIDEMERSQPLKLIRTFTDSFPNLTAIIGVNGYEKYRKAEEATVTSRELINPKFNDTIWIDAYNTAIQLDSSNRVEVYNKSKLVPGVERMPYPGALHFLEFLAMDLGGISGTLAIQKDREVFFNKDSIGVATAICYESVFGEYVSRYINNGANIIFIITNDGWWGNTAGHKQHYLYAKLRAIENRKSIARSANTGTSCFINQRGDISQATEWEKDAVINQTIYANDIITFYDRNGDYIGRTAIWVAVFLFLLSFVSSRTDKFKFRVNKL